jgi:succinate-semialdehyde dehydrogenase/glutarate-semialdehyde dehydrogenase
MMTTYSTLNPATEAVLETYAFETAAALMPRLHQMHQVWQTEWSLRAVSERLEPLRALATVLRSAKEELALLITTEMGKPISQSYAEIEKCAWLCEYYAEHAEAMLQDKPVNTGATRSLVSYQPLGILLAIMPWNFPLWQVFRALVPAMAVGNGLVLKHAPNTTACALALKPLLAKAGFPDGVFDVFLADNPTIATLIAQPEIAAVTLTGSTRAGKEVARTAGMHLKKGVYELGGSDPYLVLEDADVALAVEKCVSSRMLNTGQSCIAAKRFIVHHSVYDEFAAGMVEKMSTYQMGDPLDEATHLGPLARQDLRDALHRQVQISLERGAVCLCGGEVPDRSGWYYPATMLSEVKPGMPAFDEELFGPVAALIRVGSEQEAIALANQSPYGLGAAVFSRDSDRAYAIARTRLQAGSVFVNDFVRSDPRLPFGGLKDSGYGRELASEGLLEFVNIKTIYEP